MWGQDFNAGKWGTVKGEENNLRKMGLRSSEIPIHESTKAPLEAGVREATLKSGLHWGSPKSINTQWQRPSWDAVFKRAGRKRGYRVKNCFRGERRR